MTERLENDTSPVTGGSYATRVGEAWVVVRDANARAMVVLRTTRKHGPGEWLDFLVARDLGLAL